MTSSKSKLIKKTLRKHFGGLDSQSYFKITYIRKGDRSHVSNTKIITIFKIRETDAKNGFKGLILSFKVNGYL